MCAVLGQLLRSVSGRSRGRAKPVFCVNFCPPLPLGSGKPDRPGGAAGGAARPKRLIGSLCRTSALMCRRWGAALGLAAWATRPRPCRAAANISRTSAAEHEPKSSCAAPRLPSALLPLAHKSQISAQAQRNEPRNRWHCISELDSNIRWPVAAIPGKNHRAAAESELLTQPLFAAPATAHN